VAYQQLVAHGIAQAAHGVADGGLGDGQVFGGAGQAAFGHDLVEHAQQVQVQGAEVKRCHGVVITDVNTVDSKYKFEQAWGKPYSSSIAQHFAKSDVPRVLLP
jgi:hypothetical protein